MKKQLQMKQLKIVAITAFLALLLAFVANTQCVTANYFEIVSKAPTLPEVIDITVDGATVTLVGEFMDTPPAGTHVAAKYSITGAGEVCYQIDPEISIANYWDGVTLPICQYLYQNEYAFSPGVSQSGTLIIPLLDADDDGVFTVNGTNYTNVDTLFIPISPGDDVVFSSFNESFVIGSALFEAVLDIDEIVEELVNEKPEKIDENFVTYYTYSGIQVQYHEIQEGTIYLERHWLPITRRQVCYLRYKNKL